MFKPETPAPTVTMRILRGVNSGSSVSGTQFLGFDGAETPPEMCGISWASFMMVSAGFCGVDGDQSEGELYNTIYNGIGYSILSYQVYQMHVTARAKSRVGFHRLHNRRDYRGLVGVPTSRQIMLWVG